MSLAPWSQLISMDTVLELQQEGISRYGGINTANPKDGCVERSLGAAWNAELYMANEDALQGLLFAGCLLFYLAKNHCFIDGNKRVAWMAAMEVLLRLDLTLDISEDEAEAYCLSILSGEVAEATDVSVWMADRVAAIEE